MLGSEVNSETEARRAVMGLCAAATGDEVGILLKALPESGAAIDLRPPKVGLIMLRGRMGGEGAAFNLGEATVARASVQLSSGTVGFAYHLGRDLVKARRAALVDALWQEEATRERVETALIPIRRRLSAIAALQARQTAATRVEFFTMIRGDN
ncbi:alpha-D-ribose 1-methylphosphonate 5-triphosphate synthase subunit PhnG [Arboricoccus pini]|uniref:Alpha-D-ribose 1-methylphosphonate 5-triphosphate synthase subunit PhnG n=1 Tax=Arboricoccus pini TaxID=1963835 RepID=A0A212R209_9PROT|nr:phosphonate C-P lyase system protein PhnG [Arboricoccus pini]SNB66042.1 alpha-D-ribose 1-methylphosphonate 5-triphosphate synthase subunit PhnG [Arboricoccus pini]